MSMPGVTPGAPELMAPPAELLQSEQPSETPAASEPMDISVPESSTPVSTPSTAPSAAVPEVKAEGDIAPSTATAPMEASSLPVGTDVSGMAFLFSSLWGSFLTVCLAVAAHLGFRFC